MSNLKEFIHCALWAKGPSGLNWVFGRIQFCSLVFLSGYWLEIIVSDWKTCSGSPQGLTDLSSHQQWSGKRKTLLLLAENKKKKILLLRVWHDWVHPRNLSVLMFKINKFSYCCRILVARQHNRIMGMTGVDYKHCPFSMLLLLSPPFLIFEPCHSFS